MTGTRSGFDLAVIGSGGAAFAAAIAARTKGRSVVMVERGTVGGTCVNTGCVPSKALLAAAEARHIALAQPFPGISTDAAPVDFATLIGGKRAMVDAMRADKYEDLAAEYDWPILTGAARFTPGPVLEVALADGSTTVIDAAHYVIATGSAPWTPPIEGLDEAGYLTSTTAMELDHLPQSMIVAGGSAVGLEQGQLFARLGVTVTVVEALERLAPFEEPEVSAVIEDVFRDEGIAVHTGAALTAVRRDDTGGFTVTAAQAGKVFQLTAEQLLIATGRRPVTDGLGLDAVGVKTGERGEVVVDEHLRTGNERIWAAGDVTGHPQFVYVAGAHGTLVADNALDPAGRTLDYHHLPRVTFTSPAIAAAGLTDAQAVAQGYACDCRVLPLEYVPRALVNRDTRGLIKLVAEAGSGRLLGVHVIAEGAGDVIATAVYALANHMTVQQMADLWCPYLTMAEGLKLAAQTYTRDVAKLSCCAS
ncbi:mercury(II) reductase [Streptomyces sp. ISL-22]|uniref:mercury(II) reductase n=1 Tax=unclassified Streptomyces TaxID=2593676 RepID=UPI001BEC099F|nr:MULTISPECIES: mercury(II) reductase [unclassified Streptomyces]MBT2419385.1 mercury(II) reductase [Streptomyces sp. ISL-24]MBT2436881.1 mercury(II) reductase [Streptomyces sp. ISL-22]